jgi:hypothetical protein
MDIADKNNRLIYDPEKSPTRVTIFSLGRPDYKLWQNLIQGPKAFINREGLLARAVKSPFEKGDLGGFQGLI